MWIAAREHGAAALAAHAGLDETVCEESAILSEGDDVGGSGYGGPSTTEGVVAQLVGHEDYYIWTRVWKA
jgi:hypothetical protein